MFGYVYVKPGSLPDLAMLMPALAAVVVADCLATNMLTTDMYQFGYVDYSSVGNTSVHRQLGPGHATPTPSDPVGKQGRLSAFQHETVTLHSAFYIIWLVGSCFHMMAHLRVFRPQFKRPKLMTGIYYYFLLLNVLICTMMAFKLMSGDRFAVVFAAADFSWPLQVVRFLSGATAAAPLHWIGPYVFYRAAAPRGAGLSITLSLHGGKHGSITPTGLVSAASRILAALCCGSFLMQDLHTTESASAPLTESVVAPLTSNSLLTMGFKMKSYRYFFVAGWTFLVMIWMAALVLFVVKQKLEGYGKARYYLNVCVSALLFLAIFVSILEGVPQYTSQLGPRACTVLLPLWIVTAHPWHWRSAMYAGIALVLGISSPFSEVANVMLIGTFQMYLYAMPPVPELWLTMERHERS
jgi:hypothetical protein